MFDNFYKIKALLSRRQQIMILYLIFLLSIGMVLEVISLSMIIPLVSSITDLDYINSSPLFKYFSRYIKPVSPKLFFKIFLIAIFLVYFIKTIFLVFVSIIQFKFLANLQANLNKNLFFKYMHQNYSFYLDRNTDSMIKNIQIEIPIFMRYVFGLITFFVESGVVIAVISTILFVAPIAAVSVGVFILIASFLFFNVTKNKMSIWGKEREIIDASLTKTLLEGLGGIKEFKVLKRENHFTNSFGQMSFERAKLHAFSNIFTHLPRFYLEIISIVGIVGFVFTLILQDNNFSSMVSILGVFIAATFRLIPSINKILASLQTMKYQNASLDLLFNEFKILKKGQVKKKSILSDSFNESIQLKKIFFKYGGKDKHILDGLDLEIKKGEMIGIIGESGSGKSTLVDLILGLHTPYEGYIMIDGKSISISDKTNLNMNVGYVPQQIFLIDDTIEKNITVGIEYDKIDTKLLSQAIELAQLSNFIKSLPKGLKTVVGERGVQISGGQLQRIGIARALYNNPEILILDEATSALDNKTEIEFIKSIELLKSKKTIIMIAHRISSLINCDRVYNLQYGKLNEISAKSLIK